MRNAHAQDRLKPSLMWEVEPVRTGETVGLAIVMDIQPGWHVYPGKGSPDEPSQYIPTEITVDLPDGWTAGNLQWPKAHDLMFGPPGMEELVKSYAGKSIAYLPVTVPAADAAIGEHSVGVTINFQACDDMVCEMPAEAATSSMLEVVPADAVGARPADEDREAIFANYIPPDGRRLTGAQVEEKNQPGRVNLELKWQRAKLVPGDQIGLAVVMTIEETWHINPGVGSGEEHDYPTSLDFQAPARWKVSKIQWPETSSVLDALGENEVAVYEGRSIAFVGLTVPQDLEPGDFALTAKLVYQACDPEICEPPVEVFATTTIEVVDPTEGTAVPTPDPETVKMFRAFNPASAFASAIQGSGGPKADEQAIELENEGAGEAGGGFINWAVARWYGVLAFIGIAMVFMIVRTFMITQRIGPRVTTLIVGILVCTLATSFVFSATSHAEGWEPISREAFDKARERGDLVLVDFTAEWCLNCKTVEKYVLKSQDVQAIIDRPDVSAFIADITTQSGESQEFKDSNPNFGGGIPILAIYQPGEVEPTIFQGLYTLGPVLDALEGHAAKAAGSGHEFDFLGMRFSVDAAWIIFLLAALAGFFLNLTPCVLPVIPIKILSLQAHAKNPGRCFFLGLVFGCGIVAMFAVLGVLMGGLVSTMQWGEFFQHWWANLALGLIILIMALGMFGAFTTRLPNWVYMFNPQSDSAKGSFFLGMLTAVLSTPCAGPLLGAAITWAVTLGPIVALFMFIAMGIGMALPYVILTANPKWIDRMPKSGPGSELVKQVMGLLMIAAAVFFLGTVPLIWSTSATASAAETASSTPAQRMFGQEGLATHAAEASNAEPDGG